MCFASIMDFIWNVRHNGFKPLQDIKREISISKKIKERKKEEKNNLTQKDKELKQKKFKKIGIGILLFLTIPINILIDANGWYSNETLYVIATIISVVCAFAGFSIICLTFIKFENKK